MIKAFVKFHKGIFLQSLPIKLWLAILVSLNFMVPPFYIHTIEAQATLVAAIAGMMVMVYLIHLKGYTRLLGLGHIFWVPLIVYLWTRLGLHPMSEFMGMWIRALILLNVISLVVDGIEVGRFISGDRKETVNIL